MKPTPRLLRRWTALAGILILAVWAGPAAMAAGHKGVPLRVVGLTVGGNGVEVTILNPAPERQRGTVIIRVRLGDQDVDARVSVVVPGGQKVFIVVPPPGPPRRGIPYGVILDDGTPF